MRASPAVLLVLVLVGAAACNPTLRGECKATTDCSTGLVCENRVCVNPKWANTDGGSVTCSPACGDGLTCEGGSCVQANGVGIRITSPVEGAALAGKPLKVIIEAVAPDTIDAVEARLESRGQIVLQGRALAASGGGYEAMFDLSVPTITDGNYQLVARLYRGEKRDDSAPVHIVIDKTGPVIALIPVAYPERAPGAPAEGAFLRDETVVLDANITDPLTGLSTEPPVLVALGMDPVVGVPLTGHIARFTFSARAPLFRAVTGPVNVKILASDAVGNTGSLSTSFQLSRERWTWTKPGTKGTSTAPAIVGDLLVIGGDDSTMHGIRRGDGSTAWDLTGLAGAPMGHVAAGASKVFAALADGHVISVDPRDASVGQRVGFTCPGTGGFQPQLRRLVSGLAIANTPTNSAGTSQEETLFAYTADGYVRVFRNTAFPNGYGQSSGCLIETTTGATNDGSVPALVADGGTQNILVGDAHGQVHNVTLAFSQQSNLGQWEKTFQLNSKWGYDTRATITSSVAIGTLKNVVGMLVGSGNGLVQALDTNNAELWTSDPVAMATGIRATPVTSGGVAYVHDQSGHLQQVSADDGTFQWTQDATLPSRSTGARASPVLAHDGSVFVAGGPVAAGVDTSGRTLWSFDARTATDANLLADAVSPVLSCDGTLYVVATNADHAFVHALITDSTGGLASTGWPAGSHDSRNTGNANQPLVGTSGTCSD